MSSVAETHSIKEEGISLRQLTQTNPDNSQDEARDGSALPPVDGGRQAWLFLAAATMLEASIWGFAASLGIFAD